jgi:hypothetical protein
MVLNSQYVYGLRALRVGGLLRQSKDRHIAKSAPVLRYHLCIVPDQLLSDQRSDERAGSRQYMQAYV